MGLKQLFLTALAITLTLSTDKWISTCCEVSYKRQKSSVADMMFILLISHTHTLEFTSVSDVQMFK
eukprot:6455450-Amphidinium_carterae.1